MGGAGKRFPLCRQSASDRPSDSCRFSFTQIPARYNSSRTDGRIDPGVLNNTPNRPGRQITGDRMFVLALAPLLALTKEERLLLWAGILVGVLLLGAAIIARVDRWRKRQMEPPDDESDHMMSFREMYERGELSKKEYDRVLRRVAERVGAKPKPAPTAPAPTQPAASTQEPAAGPTATEEPPAPPPG